MNLQTKTLSVRVKDKHAKLLRQMSYEVNQCFNLSNELTMKAGRNYGDVGPVKPVWLSAYDIQKPVLKFRNESGFIIPSHTAQEVCAKHAQARKQFSRSKLRWRASSGRWEPGLQKYLASINVTSGLIGVIRSVKM